MKLIGRIFYIILVFLIIATVQMTGGIRGLQMSSFIQNNLHSNPDDPLYTLEMISGVLNIYFDANQDNWDVITIDSNDGRFDFDLTLVPFGSPMNIRHTKIVDGQEQHLDAIFDGFIVWLSRNDSRENFTDLTLTFSAINLDSPNNDPIVRTLTIYTQASSAGFPIGYTWLSYSEHFLAEDIRQRYGSTNEPLARLDFTTLGRYNINSLLVGTSALPNNQYIFFGYEPGARVNAALDTIIPAQVQAPNFIDEYNMLFSYRLFGSSTDNPSRETLLELAADGTIIFMVPNLSPYIFWYFIIWGIYIILIVVIPYFWMFRKPIKQSIQARKEKKKREEIAVQKQTNTRPYKTVQDAQRIQEERKQNNKPKQKD